MLGEKTLILDHGEFHPGILRSMKITANPKWSMLTIDLCQPWISPMKTFSSVPFQGCKEIFALFVREWLHIAKGYRETLGIKKIQNQETERQTDIRENLQAGSGAEKQKNIKTER